MRGYENIPSVGAFLKMSQRIELHTMKKMKNNAPYYRLDTWSERFSYV